MTLKLVIDSSRAGLVIGRAGSTINRIQRDSGATALKVVDGDTTDTRVIIVMGTDEAKNKAKDLIAEIVTILSCTTTAATKGKPKWRRPKRDDSPEEKCVLTPEQWAEIDKENAESLRLLMESLPPIIKNFYVEHKEVQLLSAEQVDSFRLENNNIMVEYVEKVGDCLPIPKPILKFEHAFHAYPEIMKVIKKQKFDAPTSIQCQAWPIILSGHDVIGIAQTGTGKTLSFILPAIIHLLGQPTPRKKRIGPTVLILCPTRELVLQIEEEIKKYLFNDIVVISVYGGVHIENQTRSIEIDKPDIVVATPGRLNDLVGRLDIKLNHVSYMVMDEADRMLDMGFKNQIELSVRHVRPDRQTIMTSATWPTSVRQLAKAYTVNPLHITIGSIDLNTVNTVKQEIIIIEENKKVAWLDDFIKTLSTNDKVIIFMRKKVHVENLFNKLVQQNINCRCIHGGRVQIDREASLADMRNGLVSLLIATDVAARGIDIHDISLVINYDFPTNIEEYVHRIGRTGRAGKNGSAITLFSPRDKSCAGPLINILEKSKQHIPKELLRMASL